VQLLLSLDIISSICPAQGLILCYEAQPIGAGEARYKANSFILGSQVLALVSVHMEEQECVKVLGFDETSEVLESFGHIYCLLLKYFG